MSENLYPWLSRVKNPLALVNGCFIVVLLLLSLLIWREALVLENAYASNQHRQLNGVATGLDRQLQYNIDELLFYRNVMQSAFSEPIRDKASDQLLHAVLKHVNDMSWQVSLPLHRRQDISINGINRHLLPDATWFEARNKDELHYEINGILELGYILQRAGEPRPLIPRYTSRSGFYVAPSKPHTTSELAEQYLQLIEHSSFIHHNMRDNPYRALRWNYVKANNHSAMITRVVASLPVDFRQNWLGVLSMNFTLQDMNRLLQTAQEMPFSGNIVLYTSTFKPLAASDNKRGAESLLPMQQERIKKAMRTANEGDLRDGTRFITWVKLHNFDGVLVRIHGLRQAWEHEYGSMTLMLGLLWGLSMLVLIGAWWGIRTLIRQMLQMEKQLRQRVNFDGLTQLYSRGAFFERAENLAQRCKQQNTPLSVIQMDLDHFKYINDRWGHDTGDKVLQQSGAMLLACLRDADVAGRVGGEEFCILLPASNKVDAARVAERIRDCFNQREIVINQDLKIRIQASFGVSCSDEINSYAVAELQNLADRRLYQAKQNGRNQVCWIHH